VSTTNQTDVDDMAKWRQLAERFRKYDEANPEYVDRRDAVAREQARAAAEEEAARSADRQAVLRYAMRAERAEARRQWWRVRWTAAVSFLSAHWQPVLVAAVVLLSTAAICATLLYLFHPRR
jgi:hypothetical protein